mgnify:CR=1 FL=1
MRRALIAICAIALAACDEPPQEPDPAEPAPVPAGMDPGPEAGETASDA